MNNQRLSKSVKGILILTTWLNGIILDNGEIRLFLSIFQQRKFNVKLNRGLKASFYYNL